MNLGKTIIASTLLLTMGLFTSSCTSRQIVVAEPELVSTSVSYSASDLEKSVHKQINKYRASKNLPRLEMDAVISQEAKNHSLAMANKKTPFSHDGFKQRVDNIGNQIVYRSAAENVAFNYGHKNPVDSAVKGWLESPGHYKNIIGKFDKTGVGVVQNEKGEYYFTQIFILSR